MIEIKRTRWVPYSCEQMYALVNDVAHYSDFIPYCEESIVDFEDAHRMEATLTASFGGMRKTFATQNELQPNQAIILRLSGGPLTHLAGAWRFKTAEQGGRAGCTIEFEVEFEVAHRMISMLLKSMVGRVTDEIVDAFETRANKLYGG